MSSSVRAAFIWLWIGWLHGAGATALAAAAAPPAAGEEVQAPARTEEKAEEASEPKPAEAPTEKPEEASEPKPAEAPPQKPEEASEPKPAEAPTEKPAEGAAEAKPEPKPEEKAEPEPAEPPTEKPAEATTEPKAPEAAGAQPGKGLLEALELRKKKALEAAQARENKAMEAARAAAAQAAGAGVKIEIAGDGAEVRIEAAEGGAESAGAAGEAGEGGSEPSAGEGEPAIQLPPPAPVPPMFYMRDGTRLAGFPRITEIHVATAYGPLLIPVSEVQRLRFAGGDKETFGTDITSLIEQLGSEEFDVRESSMEEIRKIGSVAVPALKQYRDSEDEEIKSRVEKLIEELEEEEEEPEEEDVPYTPLKGEEDEVVTLQFTAMGRIQETEFQVTTRYGDLTFSREDIIGIVFQEPLVTKQTFQVSGQHQAGDNKWLDTGAEIAKGESFKLAAEGTITIQNYGNVACGPEGTSNVPTRFQSFPGGALVARIGEKGKPFLVGSEHESKAEEKGKLFLALALNGCSVSGNLEVVLETESKKSDGAAPAAAAKTSESAETKAEAAQQ
ncbi:MAG: hypothetical protein JXA90_04620 [Planctomycetes bacterium]|nr:hypothetical protein [Planctomycetota bacterium]